MRESLPISKIFSILNVLSLEINKETQLCISIAARPGNFGATVHNAAFKASGLNYCYMPIGVQNVEDALTGLRAFNIKGCGVSMPYKERVISLLDEVDSEALQVGAVNTIVNTEGVLKGYNTDVYGVSVVLEEARVPASITALVVGAGGIAKAIITALKKRGIQRIIAANRTSEKALQLARQFSIKSMDFSKINQIPAKLLVNATSVGMAPDRKDCIFKVNQIKKAEFVMDVPTNPMETQLCKLAKSLGPQTIPGYLISLHQAARQFELYTGLSAPLEVMRSSLIKLIK